MFGYVRPFIPELKLREYEQYKSVYCTFCHTLKHNYGQAARFTLNFDFVFLIMLCWKNEYGFSCERKSCIRKPVKKSNIILNEPEIFDLCGGLSVILSYWKIKDEIEDEPFFSSIKYRIFLLMLNKSYKKAVKKHTEFDQCVRKHLSELKELEKANTASIDSAADKFANILADISNAVGSESKRIYSELLYHLGRWIYIADAYNDLKDDLSSGNYNPIIVKYKISCESEFNDKVKNEIDLTLNQSLGRVQSAFELLDETIFSDIIRNIIYVGMPFVMDLARNGKFDNTLENINILE